MIRVLSREEGGRSACALSLYLSKFLPFLLCTIYIYICLCDLLRLLPGWILREEARQMKAEDADGRTSWKLGNIMGGGWMLDSSSHRLRYQQNASDQGEEAERRRESEGEEEEDEEEEEQDQLSEYEARGVFEEFWRYSPSFRLLSIRYSPLQPDRYYRYLFFSYVWNPCR